MLATRNKWISILSLCGLLLMFAACGGDGDTIDSNLGGGKAPDVQGKVSTPSVDLLNEIVPPQDITNSNEFAPLGTDPQYDVKPIEDQIETRPVSAKGASEAPEDALLWVSIVQRDADPDPGLPSPPFYEGDKVDLYMQYQVFPGALTISREWHLDAAGLHLIEPSVTHAEPGTYLASFNFTLPYGSANLEARFQGIIAPARTVSLVVIPDQGSSRDVFFEILETKTLEPINYPETPDEGNDEDAGGCLPEYINVEWISEDVIWVESEKELSNVVLVFEDGEHEKWDDLDRDATRVYEGEFSGTGENDGKAIVTVYVKSGCNDSGEGPGYGERFDREQHELAMAQMNWEDMLSNNDYDYNDFIGRIRITEIRNINDELVQIKLTVKAVARAAGMLSEWQFNLDASFPGATAYAIVDQYRLDGTRHGGQRVWSSIGGVSIPIFSPTVLALPPPPETNITNGIPGTTFMDGDYAEVTIILDEPMQQGTYTPIPYEPELLIQESATSTWIIGIWAEPGDPVDNNGRPLAFIVPDTFAWPLESKTITNAYPSYAKWIEWIANPSVSAEPMWWDEVPATDYFDRELFK